MANPKHRVDYGDEYWSLLVLPDAAIVWRVLRFGAIGPEARPWCRDSRDRKYVSDLSHEGYRLYASPGKKS
jgi:hypothetical protein